MQAAGRMDGLLDRYTRIAVIWTQSEDLIGLSESLGDESRRELLLNMNEMEDWGISAHLQKMGEFSGMKVQLDFFLDALKYLRIVVLHPGNPIPENLISDTGESLNSIYGELKAFRNKLYDGVSILFQAQVFLIFLLMILIAIAMEDRNRQKMDMAASRRIQMEIARAQEQERNRIALDLHDDFAQELSWMRMNLQDLELEKETLEVVDNLISRIRDLSQSLRTPDFTLEFFDDAVRDLIAIAEQRSRIIFRYLPGERSPDKYPEIYGHLYRIIQECLNNAVKYSGPCRAFIELQEEAGYVYYEYRDSGNGFDPGDQISDKRLGLKGVRNRIFMMDGKVGIESEPGHGMSLQCRIPLKGLENE
jgi:signal transduction histidine kinase